MRYRFGDLLFDSQRFELRRGEESVSLRPRALSVLQMLLENRFRLVAKQELLDQVWHGLVVSDSAIAVTMRTLRRALGDDGSLIRTVYGKGFRFTGEVLIERDADCFAEAAAPEEAGCAPPDSGRPSIAVLPFRLVGMAGPHAGLAEALPDDIITSLTQLRWLFVIARGSTFRFPSYDFRLARVGRELQVRYCLSGTMEIIGDRLHLSIELADTTSEAAIWRDRYETELRGAHELREEIVYRVASELDRRITDHEIRRARLKNPANLDAWSCYHLGLAQVNSHGPRDLDCALADFERGVALDPDFARGHAGLAHVRWLRTIQRPLADRPAEVMGMLAAAERAGALDPLDPFVIAATARARWVTGGVDVAKARFEHAIALAPSFAQAYASLSGLLVLKQESEAALRVGERAIALSPFDPNLSTWLGAPITALVQLGRFCEACDWADRALQSPNRMVATMVVALIAYHRAGRTDDARAVGRMMQRQFPGMDADAVKAKYPVMQPVLEAITETFAAYGIGSG